MKTLFRRRNFQWLTPVAAFLIIALAGSADARAQLKRAQPNPEYPKEFTERFMKAVSKGQAAEAFASLKDDWIKPADANSVVEKLTSRWVTSDILFRLTAGKRVDGACEFLGTKRVGENLLTLVYLQRFEYSALGWSFTFYKPQQIWKCIDVSFGDSAGEDVRPFLTGACLSNNSVQFIVEPFMRTLTTGKRADAFAGLERHWYKPEEAASLFARMRRELESGSAIEELDSSGPLRGAFEPLGSDSLGKNFVHCAYLQKYETTVCPWQFVFYRADEEWKLVGIAFGNKVSKGDLSKFATIERTP